MIPHLLKAKDLAKKLSLSEAVIYVWAARGQIPYYDLGEPGKRGAIRFDPVEIKQWLLSHKKTPAGETGVKEVYNVFD